MTTYAPSLLDKLILGNSRTGSALRLSAEQVKDSVARDIEMLLNTHPPYADEELLAFPEARNSLLTLGLIDISSMSLASDRDRQRISEAIGAALARHDQRLSEVEVGVRRPGGPGGSMVFTIRARLTLEPGTEDVSFDAILQPASQRYEVSRATGRS